MQNNYQEIQGMPSKAKLKSDQRGTHNSPVFETSNKQLNDIWIDLQEVQVKFSLGQELMAYYTNPHWAKSRSVVEFGSGTGYHLGRLADCFPDKSYTGIDISHELTEYAKLNEPHIRRFHCSDIYDFEEHFDFCVLRLFLQHLPDTEQVLAKIASLTNPGGAALVIDSNDSERFYHPPIPEFMQFFREYSAREVCKGRKRNVEDAVINATRQSQEWRIVKTSKIVIPSTIGNNLDLLRRTYTLFMEMLHTSGQMADYDLKPAREEWRRWCALDNAYTQVGLTLLLLERL